MKMFLRALKASCTLVLLSIALHSCLKDTCTQTYTLYTPVYKTSAEVRSNIKSNIAKPISNPGKMFVFGSYIFLNEVDKGIHIIDNRNPSSPLNKYFIDIPGNIDMAVTGNTLYADLYTDMVTMDITDPANIQVKKISENAFPFRRYSNGFVPDNTRIITDWIKSDTTVSVDCSIGGRVYYDVRGSLMLQSSAAISPAASFASATGISGSMARFTIMNSYLYTVTDNALNVFLISQPQQPVFSGKVNMTWNIETIYPFKNNLFIGSSNGMFIYGTSNPAAPNLLGSYSHIRTCDPVIADDNYAYVTLRSGTACGGFTNQLDVLNIQNLLSPSLLKTYQLTNPHGLSKDGNTLFICDGNAGLKVFDATNVNDIRLTQTITGIDTYDVIAVNGVAIVVAKDGLYQYDYSNSKDVKLLSKSSITK